MKGNECGNFYINKKFLIFFKNGKFFYVFFKSCTSLRKSTEFKLLRHFVHNFNETPSWDQDHILHPSSLPNFSACTFHCCYLKSSIYACCELFHIYQNYDKGVINACCSNYHVILSYQIYNVKSNYVPSSSQSCHIHILAAFVMIKIKSCVPFIFASLLLILNESTCQTRKNVFYFTSKALFVLEKIKLQNFTFSNFMTSSNASA